MGSAGGGDEEAMMLAVMWDNGRFQHIWGEANNRFGMISRNDNDRHQWWIVVASLKMKGYSGAGGVDDRETWGT